MKPFSLFASCLPGLESMLLAELEGLGLSSCEVVRGGVTFRGHATSIARVCLGSGLATRVLLRFERFRATQFETLRRRTAELPWDDFLESDELFDVRADVQNCRLWHGQAVEERVALGVLDRLGDTRQLEAATERDEDDDADADDRLVLRVRGSGDRFGISLDMSGAPLWRRGWRLETAKAPLREDIAHALVLASGRGAARYADPFCGSGTIGIEAACRARGHAPGRLRRFAFERTKLFAHAKREEVLREIEARPTHPVEVSLSDRDAGAVDAARRNAERAGVANDIAFETCAFSDAPVFRERRAATLVTNPPYGKRVAGAGDLRALYQRVGTLVRELPDPTELVLVTADPRLARSTGLELESVLSTEHGGIRVRILRHRRSTSEDADALP